MRGLVYEWQILNNILFLVFIFIISVHKLTNKLQQNKTGYKSTKILNR